MDIKKIEYIIEDLITPHIKENYPLYTEFLIKFGKFLDDNNYGKIMYLEDNFDPYTTFSELIELFLDEYFADIFDFEIYRLIDKNGQRFIDLSERINRIKGTDNGFKFVLQTLQEFTKATPSGNIEIDDVGTITITEPAILEYTLTSTSSNINEIEDIIENLHPAGIKKTIVVSP